MFLYSTLSAVWYFLYQKHFSDLHPPQHIVVTQTPRTHLPTAFSTEPRLSRACGTSLLPALCTLPRGGFVSASTDGLHTLGTKPFAALLMIPPWVQAVCHILLVVAFVNVSKCSILVVPNYWLCLSRGVQTRYTATALIFDFHPKLIALNKLQKRHKKMRHPTITLGNCDSSFNQGDFKKGLALRPPEVCTKLYSPGPFLLSLSFPSFPLPALRSPLSPSLPAAFTRRRCRRPHSAVPAPFPP